MINLTLRTHPTRELLTGARIFPVLGYVALIIGLAVVAWLALASLAGDYADYASAGDLLARLEGRKPSTGASGVGSSVPGSPFVEGPTVTIAGAALQQRVVEAVGKAGGSVLSSQIELQGPEAKHGYVGLSVSCEVDQDGLQHLLYDLETGMPFLFIDQLVVQVPQSTGAIGAETGPARMRLQVDVSGQWQGTK
jgi:general secretion pathway protein M